MLKFAKIQQILKSPKSHLLTSENNLIWHTTPILVALTWPIYKLLKPSLPISLLFPKKQKDVYFQGERTNWDLQVIGVGITGLFLHIPGSQQQQMSQPARHPTATGDFYCISRHRTPCHFLKRAGFISMPVNQKAQALNWAHSDLWNTLEFGVGFVECFRTLSENYYFLTNSLPTKRQFFFECQNRMFLTISGHLNAFFFSLSLFLNRKLIWKPFPANGFSCVKTSTFWQRLLKYIY